MLSIYQKPKEILAAGLLLLGLARAAAAQTPTFQPVATYSSGPASSSGFGSNPNGLVVADVNGDGRPDLLTANLNTYVAAVLLGNGNGSFQNAVTYSTGSNSSPRRIAVADVNGDGRPDLLTANQGTSTAGVLLGNGNGTFRTVTTYPAGGSPADIAVADVNADGRPDLLMANANSTVGVLLGNGNGTFQTATTFSTGAGSTPFGIAAADVNGDGKPDLCTANFNGNTASVLLGNGDGSFQTVTTYAVGAGNSPADIAVADVNGDGRPDLLTANYNTGTASVLLGNSTGTFQPAATYSTGAGSRPFGLAAADINGDGRLDLLTASGSGTAGVLPGNGDGTFQAATNYSTGSNSGSSDIAVADVNGDTKPDLLTANSNSNTLGVLLNTTVASTPTLTTISPASGPVGTRVTLTGTNLAGALQVSFNGTLISTFVSNTATQLVVDVVAGATSGPVTVTTPAGTSNALTFTVTCPAVALAYGTGYCQSGTNPTPTASPTGGTFFAAAGLSLNAATGTINLAASTPGTYAVTYTVSGSCPGSATQSVTITAPATAAFSYPTASACAGSAALLVPTLGAGATAGTFSSTTGLTLNPTTGAVNPLTSAAGTYTVTNTVAAAGGCPPATSAGTVTINALPATPTYTYRYPTLSTVIFTSSMAPAGTTYQWYVGQNPITGATSQTYTANGATAPGSYTVRFISTATGCQSAAPTPLTVTAVKKAIAGASLQLYPNPTPTGTVRLELTGFRSATQLTVFNALGRVVLTELLPANAGTATHTLHLAGAAAGVYLLRLSNADGVEAHRLVRE